MQNKPQITLTAPVTVTVSPATVIACMNGLAELPYHTAAPAIAELENAVLASQKAPVMDPPPAPPPEKVIDSQLALNPAKAEANKARKAFAGK